MKKTLSIILSAIMLMTTLTALPFSALALDPSGSCGDNATYTFNSSTGELVISGTGAIKEDSFLNNKEINSVVINNGISIIEGRAFRSCKNLTSVVIPEGVKKIEYNAFAESGLTSVTIPSSVTLVDSESLGWNGGAFYNCTSLKTVTINGANELDYGVFDGCTSLETVTLNEGTKIIGYDCFRNCISLKEIKLPNSLTSLSSDAFTGCKALSSVTFGTGLAVIPEKIFSGFKNLTSVVIPEGVKKIEHNAFAESGLTSVTIPSSVTLVDSESLGWNGGAFYNCTSLKTVTINGANELDYGVFDGCTSLETVVINEGTKIIGYDCFRNCVSLKDIYLPASLSEIDKSAFDGDKNTVIHFAGTAKSWNLIDKNNNISDKFVVSTKTGVAGNKAVGKVALSRTAFTYNGKVNKPSVKVTDKEGNTLSSYYYSVTYPAGMINVGTYSVKVTFKGIYAKTPARTLTYVINPKGTSVSKVTSKKKAAVVKWKKQAAQTTGYEIQYSLKKSFKGAKTKTVKKNTTTKLKIKKLKSKKKYYIRIRTYKTVGGKTYYSSWSKAKTVKTKK